MNVVVVGTGFGTRVIGPVFDATPRCRVVDVVSPRDEAAVRAAVTRPDVDLVSVHSPPFLHARDVRFALDAAKAVLCDKPFAMSAEEAAVLLDDAAIAGVVHLVNFEFRAHPVRVLLGRAVRDGMVGDVEHISWVHHSSGTRVPLRPYGWLFDAARGGGWVGAWASHAVDTLRFLFGEVDRVATATRRVDIPERPDANGVVHPCTAEDALTATLVLAGGATVAIDSGFAASASLSPRLVVQGSRDVIEVVADARLRTVTSAAITEEFHDDRGGDRHDVAMRRFAVMVRDAVEAGEAPPGMPTFADGHACDLVLDQLRAAPVV